MSPVSSMVGALLAAPFRERHSPEWQGVVAETHPDVTSAMPSNGDEFPRRPTTFTFYSNAFRPAHLRPVNFTCIFTLTRVYQYANLSNRLGVAARWVIPKMEFALLSDSEIG
jgi:hypothetical protein